jgi:hypothetical protein
MPKPAGHLTIAIGLPGAHGEGVQDEDALDREHDGNGEKDVVADGIMTIVDCLLHEGPPAIRRLRLVARAFEDMAQAVMAKDHHALEEAAADAHKALSDLTAD